MRAPFIWNYVLQQSSSDIHSRRARALTISTKYRLWFCHSSPFGLCLFVGFFFISFWSRLFFMAAWVKWIMVIPPYSIRVTLLIRNKSRLLLHWFDFLSFVLQPRFLSVLILQPCYAVCISAILITHFPKNSPSKLGLYHKLYDILTDNMQTLTL